MLNVEKCIYHCNSGEKSKLIENIRGGVLGSAQGHTVMHALRVGGLRPIWYGLESLEVRLPCWMNRKKV